MFTYTISSNDRETIGVRTRGIHKRIPRVLFSTFRRGNEASNRETGSTLCGFHRLIYKAEDARDLQLLSQNVQRWYTTNTRLKFEVDRGSHGNRLLIRSVSPPPSLPLSRNPPREIPRGWCSDSYRLNLQEISSSYVRLNQTHDSGIISLIILLIKIAYSDTSASKEEDVARNEIVSFSRNLKYLVPRCIVLCNLY